MNIDKSTLSTYLLTVTAMLFYGISFVSTKILLESYGPITIIFFRLTISAALLLALHPPRRGSKVVKHHRKYLVLIAFFEPFLYFLFENFGLRQVSASVAAIIIGTIPVVTPALARPLLGERPRVAALLGLGLSFAGVVVIVLDKALAYEFTPLGLILMGGAVLAAVGYTVGVKVVPGNYTPITIVRYQSTVGALLFLPLFLVFEAGETVSQVPSLPSLGHLLFLAIFPSTLSFVFLNRAIQRLGPTAANGFINLVPVFTTVVSFFVLDELITTRKLVGMAAVIAGVLLAQYRRNARSDTLNVQA
jgi:drug/metabolite transporter (DMT)-like permease